MKIGTNCLAIVKNPKALPLLHCVDVLRRVDGALQPRGPHFEVGFLAEAVEELAELLGELLAARRQFGVTPEPAFDVVVSLT